MAVAFAGNSPERVAEYQKYPDRVIDTFSGILLPKVLETVSIPTMLPVLPQARGRNADECSPYGHVFTTMELFWPVSMASLSLRVAVSSRACACKMAESTLQRGKMAESTSQRDAITCNAAMAACAGGLSMGITAIGIACDCHGTS